MNKVIITFLIFGIISCSEKIRNDKKMKIDTFEKSTILSDFDLIQNFETELMEFNTDTFILSEHSTDGGELIVFHTNKLNYIVLDFWLYGESGKLNYTYWTNKELKFKFIKQVKYEYDKPYYEENFKIDTITNYISYLNTETKLYDKNKNEINNEVLIEIKKKELESFFVDVTKGIEIMK